MANNKQNKEVLLLIDSHALIHRAFHAFPDSLVTKSGEVVNAVYGFAKLLLEVIDKFSPDYVVAVFDAPGHTVRHQQYGAYKANRSEPDSLLISQIPRIEELLQKMDIPMLRIQGYEADDIIGTLDKRHSGEGKLTIIVTGDRDLFQLVDEDTNVYLAGTAFSASKLFDAEAVKEKMGVAPDNIIDIKALQGDSSDNIPGVAGIGEKGAVDLISAFGDLDSIYNSLPEVPSRYKSKLEGNYELAKLSKSLATIIREVPLSFDFKTADFGTFNPEELRSFFLSMEFRSLLGKIENLKPRVSTNPEAGGQQLSLLGNDVVQNEKYERWNGQKLNEQVYYLLDATYEGDPLHWGFERLLILSGDDLYEVGRDELEGFIKAGGVNWLIGISSKQLLHCVQNLGLEIKLKIYDLGISTFVLSGGKTRQDLDGVLSHYGHYDAMASQRLQLNALRSIYEEQKEELAKSDKQKRLLEVESRLVSVVADMERNGIKLDTKLLDEYTTKLDASLQKVEQDIYEDVGHEFNVASPKQVGEVLFGEKGLPSGKKTKTGGYSTDERILRELISADPVVEKILYHRELSKLLGTYLRPLPKQTNADTGRIHATFNQLGAVTGRFSSQNPNLQNIPFREIEEVNLRKAFVSERGKFLVAFDYSQQELRLLAELSKESAMLEAFSSGFDIHAATASEMFDIDISTVNKEQRRIAKTINFGIIYGISAFGLADRLKIDVKKAAEFIDKYFNKYPAIKGYYQNLLAKARTEGYVETLLGRIRLCPELNSRNAHVRGATEREVMNFPLQGSAADIIKMAMVDLHSVLSKYPVKLVLQIHDELLFEFDESAEAQLDKFVSEVKDTMLGVVKLSVPLVVEAEKGDNWGEMSKI